MIKDIDSLIGKSTKELQEDIELNYKLKKCLYVKSNIDTNTFDYYIYKGDEDADKIDLQNFFKGREPYSIQLDSNKTMLSGGDTKMKLTSINMYSYISKVKTIKDMRDNINKKNLKKDINAHQLTIKECLIKIINDYLDNLNNNFKGFYKKMLKGLNLDKNNQEIVLKKYFADELEWIESDERKELIKTIKEFLLNNLDKFMEDIKKFISEEKVEEVRVYLDFSVEAYKKEFNLYLKSKAFNKDDFNLIFNDKLCGIHNNNFTLNADKPYLQNLNKPEKRPYIVSLEESMHIYYLFKYLMILSEFNNFNYDANSKVEIKYKNENGNALIEEYDNVAFSKKDRIINCSVINITHVLTKDKELRKYGDIKRLNNPSEEKGNNLEWQFNCKLFNERMNGRYISSELKVSQGEFTYNMKALLYRYRRLLWDYFKYAEKFSCEQMRKIVYSLIKELFKLKDTKKNPTYFKVMDGINFGISFIDFYENNEDGGIVMKLKELSETMKIKINDKDNINEIETDEEYYYYTGKFIRFLLDKSKTQTKTYELANPFLKVKSNKIIKHRIMSLVKKYSNEILLGNYRVNNLFKMINSYEIGDKISEDNQAILMIAIMDNINEIYIKNE